MHLARPEGGKPQPNLAMSCPYFDSRLLNARVGGEVARKQSKPHANSQRSRKKAKGPSEADDLATLKADDAVDVFLDLALDFDHFSRITQPHATPHTLGGRVLFSVHVRRMLIGTCDPMSRPIHVFGPTATGRRSTRPRWPKKTSTTSTPHLTP